ncbi:MAG TPA: right-handed parallel beta-helix repeat-containing protein [Thermoanaerobaculia bacterium]
MTRALVVAFLLSAVPLFGDVTLRVETPLQLDAQDRLTWRVFASSIVPTTTAFSFSSAGLQIVSASPGCTITFRDRADCTFDVSPRAPAAIVFVVQANRRFGHFEANVSSPFEGISIHRDAILAHEYLVTNTNDSGDGSLRQVLLDINRTCPSGEPCAPVFHISAPVPAEGFFTIRPMSPLPAITASDVFIDGRTQSRFTFDTNPSGGPEIFLDGSFAGEGHGLLTGSARVRVDEIAIGNFPGNGIEARDDGWLEVNRAWIGVDPTGVRAAPNGLRGIQAENAVVQIDECVLSGNARAGGFFVHDGNSRLRVTNCLIGIGADGVTPVGNGASGLFFHKSDAGYGWAEVTGNRIANNAHAGIGLSLAANGDFGANSFGANGGLPIDVALDGPTRDMKPGLPSQGGVVGAPEVTSVRIEGGETVITGRLAPRPSSVVITERVYLYADGELVMRVDGFFTDGNFTARIPRNLAGRTIRAATYASFAYNFDFVAQGTSELSN